LIGRITPVDAITEYPVPTANSEPSRITAGPHGNPWSTENGAHKIRLIGPAVPAAAVQAPTVPGSGQQGTAQACDGAECRNQPPKRRPPPRSRAMATNGC
jgi:virginiamycin B lyase